VAYGSKQRGQHDGNKVSAAGQGYVVCGMKVKGVQSVSKNVLQAVQKARHTAVRLCEKSSTEKGFKQPKIE
jgi:hypothetical protein